MLTDVFLLFVPFQPRMSGNNSTSQLLQGYRPAKTTSPSAHSNLMVDTRPESIL